MQPGPTRDLVMQIRIARESLGLSVSEVMQLLREHSEKTGAPMPGETTVRSVLSGDLERISGFSHEATLLPLKEVLIHGGQKDDAVLQARIDSLLDVLRIQEETIKELTRQLSELERTQQAKCEKCESDRRFYKDQIKLKDRRMERKDKWIAELLKLPSGDAETEVFSETP